jgi:hypothetical protein
MKAKSVIVPLAVLLTLLAGVPPALLAESTVKLHKWQGAIDLSAPEVMPFTLEGKASHFGEFTCYGEVVFVPGGLEGSLVGQGVAVFEAPNGDLLVANLTWNVDPAVGDFAASQMQFSFSDAVTLSDGTIVKSTGRFMGFVESQPVDLVVIAIIAILIGLLIPEPPRALPSTTP